MQDKDSAFFVDKDMPEWLFRQMDMRKMIIELAGGPVRRLIAKLYIKNKSDDDLRELISSQKPKDVLIQQKKVAEADVLVFITQVIWMHFPAIMKGWMERVFSYGFAYRLNESGWHGSTIGLFGYVSATYKNLTNELNSNFWRIPASWKAIVENNKIKHWQVYCDYSSLFKIIEKNKMIIRIDKYSILVKN